MNSSIMYKLLLIFLNYLSCDYKFFIFLPLDTAIMQQNIFSCYFLLICYYCGACLFLRTCMIKLFFQLTKYDTNNVVNKHFFIVATIWFLSVFTHNFF